MYVMRVPREEQLMCEHFGQQYREYMAATGRLLPRLKQTRPSAKNPSHANMDVPEEPLPPKSPA